MVREGGPKDEEAVMALWLAANRQAHAFIEAEYWERCFDAVRRMLPRAEMYIDEKDGELTGFIGLAGTYIEGLFVKEAARSQGVGKQLLDFVKTRKPYLTLKAYQKNSRALHFYMREGFALKEKGIDRETGEPEYLMEWRPG
ncbi:MAG: N-acetyltransferase [Oscillospiraceae bacterium]|nr:N-acetyltransferase [Oscillospiraceae bacterium]